MGCPYLRPSVSRGVEKENERLRKAISDLALDKMILKRLNVSERRACKVLGQYRSTQRHVARIKSDEGALTKAIVGLATQFGRYGYRRVTGLLRETGWKVNKNTVK